MVWQEIIPNKLIVVESMEHGMFLEARAQGANVVGSGQIGGLFDTGQFNLVFHVISAE